MSQCSHHQLTMSSVLCWFLLAVLLSGPALSDTVSTSCPPCAWIAGAINQAQSELDAAREQLKAAKQAEETAHNVYTEARDRRTRLQGQMNAINYPAYQVIPDSELPAADLARLNKLRKRFEQAEKDRADALDAYGKASDRRQALENRVAALVRQIASLKNKLSVCEREMCPPLQGGATTGVTAGSSGGSGAPATPEPPLDLARVSTDCVPHCVEAAKAVNDRIAELEALSKSLYEAKQALARATADKEEALDREDRIARQINALKGQTDSASQRRRAQLESRMEQASRDVTAAAREKIKQREKIAKLEKEMEQAGQAIDSAKAALRNCEQTKCRPSGDDKRVGYLPGGGLSTPPGQSSCFGAGDFAIRDLGQVPGNATKMIEGAARSVFGGLLGKASGGMFGMGGGGGGGNQDGADLSPNPFGKQAQQLIRTGDMADIGLDAILTTPAQARLSAAEAKRLSEPYEDAFGDMVYPTAKKSTPAGLKLGLRIPEKLAKDRKFTFSSAYLVDSDCQQIQPSGRYLYQIWEETTFSWSIEFWRWKNDALVEHWKKAGSEQWSELLADGQIPLHVGVEFAGISPADVANKDYTLMSLWTYQDNDHIYGQPLGFQLHADYDYRQLDLDDVKVKPSVTFTQLNGDAGNGRGWTIDPEALKHRHDLEGGMTKIPPPSQDLDVPEEPEVDPVVDELTPIVPGW